MSDTVPDWGEEKTRKRNYRRGPSKNLTRGHTCYNNNVLQTNVSALMVEHPQTSQWRPSNQIVKTQKTGNSATVHAGSSRGPRRTAQRSGQRQNQTALHNARSNNSISPRGPSTEPGQNKHQGGAPAGSYEGRQQQLRIQSTTALIWCLFVPKDTAGEQRCCEMPPAWGSARDPCWTIFHPVRPLFCATELLLCVIRVSFQ